jgi:hypothetical protein
MYAKGVRVRKLTMLIQSKHCRDVGKGMSARSGRNSSLTSYKSCSANKEEVDLRDLCPRWRSAKEL